MAEQKDKNKGPKYEVNFEGEIYEWHKPTITAAEIRGLVGLAADTVVLEVNLKNNSEVVVEDDIQVKLKPGHGFSKKVGFKRG